MVFLTLPRLWRIKGPIHFVDSLRINVKGGAGGSGFPKYGGVGGQGGCVQFIASEKVTMLQLAKKYRSQVVRGGVGEDSSKARILGRRGEDRTIQVPIGISILDDSKKLLAELNNPGESYRVAGGGGGGCSGNNFMGRRGQERVVTVDLKLIADVGLVGFPNAGKSTLLGAISRANPRVADYPFTTLRPQLGMVEYTDLRQITVADLPGLIEGAHANIGLGHKFLKHIERTKMLLMVVDLFGFQLSVIHHLRTCIQNIFALNKELELYDKELIDRPCVLLLNKIDRDNAQIEYDAIKDKVNDLESYAHECSDELRSDRYLKFDEVHVISAKDEISIDNVKEAIRRTMDKYAAAEIEAELEKTSGKGRTF